MTEKEFYIATQDLDGTFIIYKSDKFKIMEFDLLSIIRLLLVQRRNVSVGKKILDAYEDSTQYRKDITIERLNKIGVNNEKPTKTKNAKSR